ncbi:MAG: hypothetical protein R3309_08945, partial [Reinekea sp.]|nr:hypothetical protein [Reinekea sp.]
FWNIKYKLSSIVKNNGWNKHTFSLLNICYLSERADIFGNRVMSTGYIYYRGELLNDPICAYIPAT